ncbi:hypothetical protein [Nocardioides sp. 503]|uniref:hypothetical protein n=1 Tax=Nocardioides sp. 503 TaxID=2508326 RepID=UPI0010705854|nr:hypothetical protein [Nocardioides sp. 503]
MAERRVIGVDPGPVPGMVELRFVDGRLVGVEVVQCSHGIAAEVFSALLGSAYATPTLVQVERFVVGRSSMKSAEPGAITRDMVGALGLAFEDYDSTEKGRLGGRFLQRSASQVKPWATDARLEIAGLLEATKGMRHAKDAARHALFAACNDGGIPDPLSKDWTR